MKRLSDNKYLLNKGDFCEWQKLFNLIRNSNTGPIFDSILLQNETEHYLHSTTMVICNVYDRLYATSLELLLVMTYV